MLICNIYNADYAMLQTITINVDYFSYSHTMSSLNK